MCLPIISAENWKPATKTDQGKVFFELSLFLLPQISFTIITNLFAVVQALIALVNDPEPEHPLRADLAEEFLKDRKKFLKNAEEFTKKHAEKRRESSSSNE